MFLMCVSMARSNASAPEPRTMSSSCWRVKMRPGARDIAIIDDRQREIEHDQIGATLARCFQRASAIAGGDDVESGVPQIVAGDLRDLRLIVDDENRLHTSFIRSCDCRCHSSKR